MNRRLRRVYQDRVPEKGRLQDVDSADHAYRVKMLWWAFAGGAIGAIAGQYVAGPLGALVGLVVGYAFVYGVTALLVRSAAAAAGHVYNPSGNSTPVVREYSHAQSLVARGLYQEAIAAYELACAEYPEDPEPCFRIARLYLDELKRYEDAVTWFRKARAAKGINTGRELLATQEIVEVLIHKLVEPRRAIPELARLSERFPGTPAAAWAHEQLRLGRERLAEEIRHDGPPRA